MTWPEAVRIDWGVVLLYGGGFALGVLSFQTGLAEGLGQARIGWVPFEEGLGLVFVSTAAAAILSETTSNTASATCWSRWCADPPRGGRAAVRNRQRMNGGSAIISS